MPATNPCPQCHGTGQDTAHRHTDGTPAACETCDGYGTTTPSLHHSTTPSLPPPPTIPRELLLPIPHAIAEKLDTLAREAGVIGW